MSRLTPHMIDAAAEFIWLTGRVLDQRRLAHFTGLEPAAGILSALRAHAAGDGGYAFALEPDVKGPEAHPITVATALQILDEADALADHAAPIVDWLATVTAPDGGVPPLLPSIAEYPRPPFMAPPESLHGMLLPTARIVGLLRKHGVAHPWMEGAIAFCWSAIDALETTHPYEVHCVNVFLDHAPERERAEAASARLGRMVRDQQLVLLDPENPTGVRPAPGYAEGEFHYAHQFAPRPESLAAGWFTDEELARSLDVLAHSQLADGGWQINWRRWAPTTESDARPGVTLEAMGVLRAWDRAQRRSR
ncbi:hypothetical protein [Glycomyces tarimensis]